MPRTSLLLALFLGVAVLESCKETSRPTPVPPVASASSAAPAANAVQQEMRLLHEALRDSVTAIANGRLDAIPTRLEQVDAARRSTEHAVETGDYRLPKDPGDLATFQQLDEHFHADLEGLAAKARSNDAAATSAQLGLVLSECGTCHSRFRP